MDYRPLVLITGANQGIGYAVALQLIQRGGFRVLIGSRSHTRAEKAIGQLKTEAKTTAAPFDLFPLSIDITDDDSIAAAVDSVRDQFGTLEILINNAAVMPPPNAGGSGRQEFQETFNTNVFGAAAMIDAFLPLIRLSQFQDRRIVNVTSGLGQVGPAYSREFPVNAAVYYSPAYRGSKAALNMITAGYALTLEKEGIYVVLAAPGYCRTNMTKGEGEKDASQGAANIVTAATKQDPKKLLATVVADEWRVEELGW